MVGKLPRASGYWAGTPWIAIGMMAILVARMHELFPFLLAIRPALFFAWGGMAVALLHTRAEARAEVWAEPLFRLQLALLVWATLGIPFALWPGLARDGARTLLSGIPVVVILLLCPPTRAAVDRVQAGFVAVMVLYSVAVVAWGKEIVEGRLALGGTYDANDLAAVTAAAFPLAVGFIIRGGGYRVPALAASAMLVTSVILSGSRGGAVGLVAGAAVLVLGLKGKRRAGYSLLLILAGIITWEVATPQFRERMATMVNLEEDYNTSAYAGRKQIWKRGVGYFLEHPIAGVGVSNFQQAEGEHLTRLGIVGKWSAAHNTYVQIFAELGAVGGGIFMAMLVLVWRRALQMWRGSNSPGDQGSASRSDLLASLVAFCAAVMFVSAAYFYAMFALYALIVLAHRGTQQAHVARQAPLSARTRGNLRRSGGWETRGRGIAGVRGGLALGRYAD